MHANISSEVRKAVYRRDGYACALCDCSQGLQVHHVTPRGLGGTGSMHSLITLCSYCHAHVHGMALYETPVTAQDVREACVEYLAACYGAECEKKSQV